jgi:hypothetical protein
MLKVLFAGLLWEKNTAGWLLIVLISPNKQGVGWDTRGPCTRHLYLKLRIRIRQDSLFSCILTLRPQKKYLQGYMGYKYYTICKIGKKYFLHKEANEVFEANKKFCPYSITTCYGPETHSSFSLAYQAVTKKSLSSWHMALTKFYFWNWLY